MEKQQENQSFKGDAVYQPEHFSHLHDGRKAEENLSEYWAWVSAQYGKLTFDLVRKIYRHMDLDIESEDTQA